MLKHHFEPLPQNYLEIAMGKRIVVQIGAKYNRWTVMGDAPTRISPSGKANRYLRCLCDCGVEKDVCAGNIFSGKSISCGCIVREIGMASRENVVGKKYSSLTITRDNGLRTMAGGQNKRYMTCLCDCGESTEVSLDNLKRGMVKTCGCASFKHGMTDTPEFNSWKSMRERCDNPNNSAYPRYGGRGIGYCLAWAEFLSFYKSMGDRPVGCTLERKDPEGNYSPDNCEWADWSAQNTNKRKGYVWTVAGVEYFSAYKAAKDMGVSPPTIYSRCKGLNAAGEYVGQIEGYGFRRRYPNSFRTDTTR